MDVIKQKFALRAVGNTLQTIVVLIEDEWCRFLHDNIFVGLSVMAQKKMHMLTEETNWAIQF
jgi:sulfatase maturation enzyme AslB (radical SAM superfamily)